MKASNTLKGRFVKNKGIEVQNFSEPFFTDRLIFLGQLEEWEIFLDEVEKKYNADEQLYLQAQNKTTDDMINAIKQVDGYAEHIATPEDRKSEEGQRVLAQKEKFLNEHFPLFKIERSSKDVYNQEKIYKNFLSIDLKKANFNAMKFYSKKIWGDARLVLESETYEKLISKFTNSKTIIESKYVRQRIFGAVEPSVQTRIEKHMIGLFIEDVLRTFLTEEQYLSEIKTDANNKNNVLVIYTNDEIVFDVSSFSEDKIKEAIQKCILLSEKMGFQIHYEFFKLIPLEKVVTTIFDIKNVSVGTFFKEIYLSDDSSEFVIKKADSILFPFVYKTVKEYVEMKKGNVITVNIPEW